MKMDPEPLALWQAIRHENGHLPHNSKPKHDLVLYITRLRHVCLGRIQGQVRGRSWIEPVYCEKITTLYGPMPTLPLKFSPSLVPGLAVVSKLSPLTKAGS